MRQTVYELRLLADRISDVSKRVLDPTARHQLEAACVQLHELSRELHHIFETIEATLAIMRQ